MMKQGKIVASGTPQSVINAKNLEEIYGIHADIRLINDTPFVIPLGRVNRKVNR